MARARIIKPGFFRSRSLARCTRDARTTFVGLWSEADDAGRGIADARILKGSIWPLDDDITIESIAKHLEELATTGHIRIYDIDGDSYYLVEKWEEHQAAAYRRGEPQYPEPPSNDPESCTPHNVARATHDPARDKVLSLIGKEGKGREVNTRGGASHPPRERDREDPTGFPEFWERYPRKLARKEAAKAYADVIAGGATVEQLADGLNTWIRFWDRAGTLAEHMPYGARWLRGEHWKETPRTGGGRRAGTFDPDTGALLAPGLFS